MISIYLLPDWSDLSDHIKNPLLHRAAGDSNISCILLVSTDPPLFLSGKVRG